MASLSILISVTAIATVMTIASISTVTAVMTITVVISVFTQPQVYTVQHEIHLRQLTVSMYLVQYLKITLERIIAPAYYQRSISQTSQHHRITHQTDRRCIHHNHIIPFPESCKRIIQSFRSNQLGRVRRNQTGRQHIQIGMQT